MVPEAETGVTQLRAEGHQGRLWPPEVEAERVPTQGRQRSRHCQHLDFGPLASRLRENAHIPVI